MVEQPFGEILQKICEKRTTQLKIPGAGIKWKGHFQKKKSKIWGMPSF